MDSFVRGISLCFPQSLNESADVACVLCALGNAIVALPAGAGQPKSELGFAPAPWKACASWAPNVDKPLDRAARDDARKALDRAFRCVYPALDPRHVDVTFRGNELTVSVLPSAAPHHAVFGVAAFPPPGDGENFENVAHDLRKSWRKVHKTTLLGAQRVASVLFSSQWPWEGVLRPPISLRDWTLHAGDPEGHSQQQAAGTTTKSIRAVLVDGGGIPITLSCVAFDALYMYLALRSDAQEPCWRVVAKLPLGPAIKKGSKEFDWPTHPRTPQGIGIDNSTLFQHCRNTQLNELRWWHSSAQRLHPPTISVHVHRVLVTANANDADLRFDVDQLGARGPLDFPVAGDDGNAVTATTLVSEFEAALAGKCVTLATLSAPPTPSAHHRDDGKEAVPPPSLSAVEGELVVKFRDSVALRFGTKASGPKRSNGAPPCSLWSEGRSTGRAATTAVVTEVVGSPAVPTSLHAGDRVVEDEGVAIEYKFKISPWEQLSESLLDEARQKHRSLTNTERAREILAAFANTTGGTLLVGVDDAGIVVGAPPGSIKEHLRLTGFCPPMAKDAVLLRELRVLPAGGADGLATGWWKAAATTTSPAMSTSAPSAVVTCVRVTKGVAPFHSTSKYLHRCWPPARGFASTVPLGVHPLVFRIADWLESTQIGAPTAPALSVVSEDPAARKRARSPVDDNAGRDDVHQPEMN